MLALILIFVRETHNAELLRRKAKHLRKTTGEERWIAPVEKLNRSFFQALKASIKTPFSECFRHRTFALRADSQSCSPRNRWFYSSISGQRCFWVSSTSLSAVSPTSSERNMACRSLFSVFKVAVRLIPAPYSKQASRSWV